MTEEKDIIQPRNIKKMKKYLVIALSSNWEHFTLLPNFKSPHKMMVPSGRD